jgi:hypothetical protein
MEEVNNHEAKDTNSKTGRVVSCHSFLCSFDAMPAVAVAVNPDPKITPNITA